VLDAAGYLTENVYNGAGELTQTVAYSSASSSALRLTGSLPQLRPVLDATVSGVILDGQRVTKVSGAGGATNTWDSGFRSNVGYTGGAAVSFTAGQTNQHVMVGLNTDSATNPVADNNYTSIDYAMYCTASGTLQAYESGAPVQTFGTYSPSDVLSVTYDGATIRYLQNGVVLRAVSVVITQPLYADSSFYGFGGKVENVQFTPSKDSQNAIRYFFYDGEGRQIGSLDAEGYFTETQYDVAGNVTIAPSLTSRAAAPFRP
jgi:YD repeat-containing protein